MLDMKYIRANPELVKAGAAKKRIALDLDAILALDERVRASLGIMVDQLLKDARLATKTQSGSATGEGH